MNQRYSERLVQTGQLLNLKGRVPNKKTAKFETFIKLELTPPTPGVIVTPKIVTK